MKLALIPGAEIVYFVKGELALWASAFNTSTVKPSRVDRSILSRLRLAQWKSRRRGAKIRAVHKRRNAEGIYPLGIPPSFYIWERVLSPRSDRFLRVCGVAHLTGRSLLVGA